MTDQRKPTRGEIAKAWFVIGCFALLGYVICESTGKRDSVEDVALQRRAQLAGERADSIVRVERAQQARQAEAAAQASAAMWHKDFYAQVVCNTEWSGAFGNRTVDGSGTQRVDLPDDWPVCVSVQKKTDWGELKVLIGFRRNKDDFACSDWVTTTAEYGLVMPCCREPVP